jgi:carboxyl-terminal processing protease
MFRKFKLYVQKYALLGLWSVSIPIVSLGSLSREETFEQSFDLVWGTVQESHWDETFGGLDWDVIGEKYRSRLKNTRNRTDLVALLQNMLNELDLSHYNILSNSVKRTDDYPRGGYVGLELKYIEDGVYVTSVDPESPAASAGIKRGWRLKSIHRKSVKSLISPFLKYEGPQKRKRFDIEFYLNALIQGASGRKIRTDWYPLEGRALKTYMLPRTDARELSESVGYLPPQRIEFEQIYLTGDILYLRFNFFTASMMTEIRESLESASGKASGLILDLRSNAGGLAIMASAITGLLVDEKTNLGKLDLKNGYITYQGYPQRKRFQGPVAILIDGNSVSTSEMLAAGLQEVGRARIFGEPSLGESLPSLFRKLPSGDVFQYAVGDYHTPNGFRIEKNGVLPDELIVPTADDLKAGRDLPLEKASEWILNPQIHGNEAN